MSGYRILRQLTLGPSTEATGKTRHFSGGGLFRIPAELQVVELPGSPGYYLLYFDDSGREMTDTFHDSVEQAVAQAEWEFNVKGRDWLVYDDA